MLREAAPSAGLGECWRVKLLVVLADSYRTSMPSCAKADRGWQSTPQSVAVKKAFDD